MTGDGVHNAIIEDVRLEIERGTILSSWVFVQYGTGGGQGFGGYALHLDETFRHHDPNCVAAGRWIWNVLKVAGVENWSHVKGKAIRCRVHDGRIVAIAHITKDVWFEPEKDLRPPEANA